MSEYMTADEYIKCGDSVSYEIDERIERALRDRERLLERVKELEIDEFHDHYRFTAAVAAMQAHRTRCGQSLTPLELASFAFMDADALLERLAKKEADSD